VQPDARSSNGTPLFKRKCQFCGIELLGDKRKFGKPCLPCALRAKATHGKSSHKIYRVWAGIKARCYIPSASNYQYYGGRGISMCDEWRNSSSSFFKWAEQNGFVEGLEIDRIDNDGNYCPENCRFVPHKENSRKSRKARATAETASAAKKLLSSGHGVINTASSLGLTYMSVWHIKNGDTWTDIA